MMLATPPLLNRDVQEDRDKAMLAEINRVLSLRRIELYRPYPKQLEFHTAGGDEGVRERLLMAANQVGKTWCAGSEVAYHATGLYPSWWQGVRFDYPTVGWTGSPTGQTSRDTVQRILLGRPGEWGTGAIPSAKLIGMKRSSHGVPDQIESITVEYVTGGTSLIVMKTYDQGRLRWQGETIDYVWFDEEPPIEIYTEGLTRTNVREGPVFLTFTPLLGMSEVVKRFILEKVAGTHVTTMTIEDAEHYTKAQRDAITRLYPPHEREARTKGVPILGSGRIFPVTEESIMERAFPIPPHWPRIAGLDFGYDHPTAAVWLAWDRDADIVHVYDAYRLREATPVIHAAAIKGRGPWIPVAWPHDGYQHDKGGSCEQLAAQYKKLGLNMLREHATHPPAEGQLEGEGGFGVEAGLMLMLDRMQMGQLRVAAHLNEWWEEFRLYHRDKGKVVKVGDDLMSATRIALMMLRKAKTQPIVNRAVFETSAPHASMGVLGR